MKVSLIASVTADGLIGRSADHLADWTSKEDKQLFVQVTKEAGTIVMGSRTFQTMGRALPGRRMIVLTSTPSKFDVAGVEFTDESPTVLIERLSKDGCKSLVVCGGARVYYDFMAAGLVDELYLTVEPYLFGEGVPLFSGKLETRLILKNLSKLNDSTVLLRYKVLQ